MRGGYRTKKKERTDTSLVFEPTSAVPHVFVPQQRIGVCQFPIIFRLVFFFFFSTPPGYKERVGGAVCAFLPVCLPCSPQARHNSRVQSSNPSG